MARRKSRQFKKKKKPSTPKVEYFGDAKGGIEHLEGMIDDMKAKMTFDDRWNEHFDAIAVESKHDAGYQWAAKRIGAGKPGYHLYNSKTNRKERKHLLKWFQDHFRRMAPKSLWQMENGITYIINKKTKTVYHIHLHPYLYNVYKRRYPQGRGNHIVRIWKEGNEKEYASGGHKSFFHEANLFFFKELGYKYELVNLAPGWWYNCGAARIATGIYDDYKQGNEEVVKEVNRIKNGNENNGSENNAVMQVIALSKVGYREIESERIADQFERVVRLEFDDPRDAVLYTDSDGIPWTDEDMNHPTSMHGEGHFYIGNDDALASGGNLSEYHQKQAVLEYLKKNPQVLSDELREQLDENPDEFLSDVVSRMSDDMFREKSDNLEQE